MAFKNNAAGQHMNAEVAAMSGQVFSQYSHLVDLGRMVGYGEDEDDPQSDDPLEALVLDLLAVRPNATGQIVNTMIDPILRKHLTPMDSNSQIYKIMEHWSKGRILS